LQVFSYALKGQWIKIAKLFCIALSGRSFGDRYPPRCGGLLRIAPNGAKEKRTYNPTYFIDSYFFAGIIWLQWQTGYSKAISEFR
jgi:hypothetical protein